MAECIHEMAAGTCGFCHVKPADKPLASGPTIEAQGYSRCACGCGTLVAPYMKITYSSEADGWALAEHVTHLEMP